MSWQKYSSQRRFLENLSLLSLMQLKGCFFCFLTVCLWGVIGWVYAALMTAVRLRLWVKTVAGPNWGPFYCSCSTINWSTSCSGRSINPPVILICRPLVYCSTSSCSSRPQRTRKTVPALISKAESWLDRYFAQLSLFFDCSIPGAAEADPRTEAEWEKGSDNIVSDIYRCRRYSEPTVCDIYSLQHVSRAANPSSGAGFSLWNEHEQAEGRSYVVASGGSGEGDGGCNLKKGLTLLHLIIWSHIFVDWCTETEN